MTTVGKLIEILSSYNKDAYISNQELEEFVHISHLTNGQVIISTERPIGYCNRSGGYAFLTDVEDYLAVVPELDENVDFSEITLPNLEEEDNPQKFGKPIERESKYKKGFEELLCYFDSISEDEQPKIAKKLEELGLI